MKLGILPILGIGALFLFCLCVCVSRKHKDNYRRQGRLIEPANIFAGDWQSESKNPMIELTFDDVDHGTLSVGKEIARFKYRRVKIREEQWAAIVMETDNPNLLRKDTAFSLASRESGVVYIPKFLETPEGVVDVKLLRQ